MSQVPPGLHVRQQTVQGIGPWIWVKDDKFGWEQPANEFPGLRDLILAHTKQRRVIIQAGGCCGMYPKLWSVHFDTVYTFEPEARNFYCLVANCPSERIIKMQAALSNRAGVCTIASHHSDANVGMARIGKHGEGTVPTFRLDDFRFPVVDVLQLDCEGHEEVILSRACDLIMRHLPVISVEAPSPRLAQWLNEIAAYEEVGRTGDNPDVVFAAKKSAPRA